ncbi:hypothetical protein Tco_1259320 [Tanacetum coccineum]
MKLLNKVRYFLIQSGFLNSFWAKVTVMAAYVINRLWRLDDVKQEIIISRDVVYDENLIYKDTLKGAGAEYSGKEVEFELELQESRFEPTVDPHTGENP